MDALILCGGFATRLEPITLFVPKPLLPVGGRPIVDYIVENVVDAGVDRIIFSTNWKFDDQFEYWLDHKKSAGIKNRIKLVVEPATNNNEKFGAVKGISYTIDKAALHDDLMIVAGDNYYKFDLRKMIDHFNKYRKPTVALHDIGSTEEAKRFGVVQLSDHKVVAFDEKPKEPKSTLVSTGLYIYPKEMLHKFKEYVAEGKNPDAPGYFMQWLIKDTEVHGVVYDEDWFDVGTVDTYKEVFEKYLKDGKALRNI